MRFSSKAGHPPLWTSLLGEDATQLLGKAGRLEVLQ
jgi:hypothetical protein